MRILVTVGGGFFGAWLIRRILARGWDLRVFNRTGNRRIVREIVGTDADMLDWFIGDVSDADAVTTDAADCDIAIRAAPACSALTTERRHARIYFTAHSSSQWKDARVRIGPTMAWPVLDSGLWLRMDPGAKAVSSRGRRLRAGLRSPARAPTSPDA